jgi:type IV pilus assembly protein PilP
MNNSLIILRNVGCLICALSLLWGCGNRVETSKDPNIVSKRIIKKPHRQKVNVSKKTDASKTELKTKPVISKKPKAEPPSGLLASIAPLAIKGLTSKKKSIHSVYGYNPDGKVDPFAPLFKDKPVVPAVAKKKKKKKRIPLTPLEKVDLSQLKLVGIIRAASGNRALVQEASGKGYVTKMGTYIGIHSGKIVEIKKDKIIVEEEVENVLGEFKLTKRELKLQKPPGEF